MKPKEWEYLIVELESFDSLIETLNFHGMEGWEAFQVYGYPFPSERRILFKRERHYVERLR